MEDAYLRAGLRVTTNSRDRMIILPARSLARATNKSVASVVCGITQSRAIPCPPLPPLSLSSLAIRPLNPFKKEAFDVITYRGALHTHRGVLIHRLCAYFSSAVKNSTLRRMTFHICKNTGGERERERERGKRSATGSLLAYELLSIYIFEYS